MPENPSEKLEFLKREEIKTMQKDLKILKEGESLAEKERIKTLKIGEEKRAVEGLKIPPKPEFTKPIGIIPNPAGIIGVMPGSTRITPSSTEKSPEPKEKTIKDEKEIKLPKPPSKIEKVLVRIVVIFIIFLILISAFWYFGIKKAGIEVPKINISNIKFPWTQSVNPTPLPTQSPEISTTPQASPAKIIIPESLIPVQEIRTIEINNVSEIPVYISQLLKETSGQKTLIRVVIKNLTQSQIIGLSGFLGSFGINPPADFYQKIDDNFTLFIYTQEEGNRIGFVAKINDNQNFKTTITAWEQKMKTDFIPLFSLMAQTETTTPYFKTATYKTVPFRYQTFSVPHFGICYSIYNNYFIFTSSGKSMMKIIDQLTQK